MGNIEIEVWFLAANGLTLFSILADYFIKSFFPKRWFCFNELISIILQLTLDERKTLWKVMLTFKAARVSFGTFLLRQLLPFECLQSYLQPSLWSLWGFITFLTGKYEDLQCWLPRRICFGDFTDRAASVL